MSKLESLKEELESVNYENEKLFLFLKEFGLSATEIISNIIYGEEEDRIQMVDIIKDKITTKNTNTLRVA